MNRIQELESRREEALKELAAIRSLRKGSINEQWFPVVLNGKKTKKLRGPYYVWTYKVAKKTVSERLKGEQEIAVARQDAANYSNFRDLCLEFEKLTAELGVAERQGAASEEALKKGLKSRSSRVKK